MAQAQIGIVQQKKTIWCTVVSALVSASKSESVIAIEFHRYGNLPDADNFDTNPLYSKIFKTLGRLQRWRKVWTVNDWHKKVGCPDTNRI